MTRLIVLCHSLASDWQNPAARGLRGLLREVSQAGHEVMVYEPAGNSALVGQLRACGAAFLRDFDRRRGDVQRYTFPLTSGQALTLWLCQALATFDVCLVDARLPVELLRKVGQLTAPALVTLLYDMSGELVSGGPAWWEAIEGRNYARVVAGSACMAGRYSALGAPRVTTLLPWADLAEADHHDGLDTADVTLVGEGRGDTPALTTLAALARALPDRRLQLLGDDDGEAGEAAVLETSVRRVPACERRTTATAYAAARLALHVPGNQPGLSARPLEALAHDVPVVALGWDGDGILQAGDDFATAESDEALAAVVEHLLTDEPARQRLAERGRQAVLERHTSAIRARHLLVSLASHVRDGMRIPGQSPAPDDSLEASAEEE